MERDKPYQRSLSTLTIDQGSALAAQGNYSTDFPEDFAADPVVQKLQLGTNQYFPAPVPGGLIATTGYEVFGVGANGAVWTSCKAGANWTETLQITPPDFAAAGGSIAATIRTFNGQTDAFFIGFDGALWTVVRPATRACVPSHIDRWLGDHPVSPWSAPIQLSPVGQFPVLGRLAAIRRGARRVDLFAVDQRGTVRNLYVIDDGAWQEEPPLSGPGFAPPGAALAAVERNSVQEDLFVVTSGHGLQTFFRGGNAPWTTQPAYLLVGKGVPDQTSVAVLCRNNANREDLFYVDDKRVIQTLHEQNDGPWTAASPISEAIQLGSSFNHNPTPLPPMASVAVAFSSTGSANLFAVDTSGITRSILDNSGSWMLDGSLAAPTLVPAPGGIAAANASQNALPLAWIVAQNGSPLVLRSAPGRVPLVFRNNLVAQSKITTGLPMWSWLRWPHIHGAPVVATFPSRDGRGLKTTRIFAWPERDHLKSFVLEGNQFREKQLAVGTDGRLALGPNSMPGGMLSVVVDPDRPESGVLFASILHKDKRCTCVIESDAKTNGCSLDPNVSGSCDLDHPYPSQYGDAFNEPESPFTFGWLRAFDPITMREIWNNESAEAGHPYRFSKFVTPTLAAKKVFLPTAEGKVLVYGESSQ